MKLLDERVALISGVGQGLGGACARLFVEHGAKVALLARTDAVTRALAEELGQENCLVVSADIQRVEDCGRAVRETLTRFGRIDVLVNVAGRGDRANRAPLLELDDEFTAWRESFEINVIGTMKITRAVTPHMMARKRGAIIMTNSMTGERVRPHSYAYSGAKAALQRVAQVLALELAPHGVRVNSLHPGYMWGPVVEATMQREAAASGVTEAEWREATTRQIPLGYIPPVSEYAGALLFMASDLSQPMTGASLHVNGGEYMR